MGDRFHRVSADVERTVPAPLVSTFQCMILNMRNRTPGAPIAPYTKLSEIVLRFADAVETLMTGDLAYPFSVIPSDALRDRAADGGHTGTLTTRPLTGLAMNQVYAAAAQCDLHRGMAAVLPADKVFFSSYPLARTCVATAAKAWFILGGATVEERLMRYLNEELAALYGAPWDFDDPDSSTYIAGRTEDHLAVGKRAGLEAVYDRKKPNAWDAPRLVRAGEKAKPSSETAVVREMFAAAGLGDDQVGKPYALLSAATHGRFRQAGVFEHVRTGRTESGEPKVAMYSTPETTAKVTVLAAIATRTHLRALARYQNVPEQLVQDRLGDPLAEWCAVGGVEVPD